MSESQYTPVRLCSVDGCGRPHLARGFCKRHYGRWQRLGTPHLPTQPSLADRLWSRVEKTPQCWVQRGVSEGGYGEIVVNGRRRLTHVVAYELQCGPVPEGAVVLHKCDNPRCVRGDHLMLGTQLDNIRDMVEKGRQARGNALPQAKLSPESVREIRAIYEAERPTFAALSARYGVSRSQAWGIVHNKTWRHVR